MISFRPIHLKDKQQYEAYLFQEGKRGCEYTFANLCLWGKQQIAYLSNQIVFFSQFDKLKIYAFPFGEGDKKDAIDAMIEDAKDRKIPFRISGLNQDSIAYMEQMYPGMFRYQCPRDSFDYVYDIDDLADLKGKKYQKKRNHYNRFRKENPDYTAELLNEQNLPKVIEMLNIWYEEKLVENPDSDFDMEKSALLKALKNYKELEMVGLVLLKEERVIAMTLGSQMTSDTFDVHFEKACSDINGAYAAINSEYAQFIRMQYPHIKFLNREEDMGLEGLRKAKESYYPHHLVEKCWGIMREDSHDN